MTRAYYEIGRSGRKPFMAITRLEPLLDSVTEVLAPGSFYIKRVIVAHPGDLLGGGEPICSEDWGTLEVHDDGRWSLHCLADLVPAAGFPPD